MNLASTDLWALMGFVLVVLLYAGVTKYMQGGRLFQFLPAIPFLCSSYNHSTHRVWGCVCVCVLTCLLHYYLFILNVLECLLYQCLKRLLFAIDATSGFLVLHLTVISL